MKIKWANPEFRAKILSAIKNSPKFDNRGFRKEYTPWNKGVTLSEKIRNKISENSSRFWLGKKLSENHKNMISQGRTGKMTGENHFAWIKDRTKIKGLDERNNPEYKQWRLKVLNKDDYRCRICGEQKKGEMIADHIFSFTKFLRLRYTLENGQALCRECHKIKTNLELRKNTQVIFATSH